MMFVVFWRVMSHRFDLGKNCRIIISIYDLSCVITCLKESVSPNNNNNEFLKKNLEGYALLQLN